MNLARLVLIGLAAWLVAIGLAVIIIALVS